MHGTLRSAVVGLGQTLLSVDVGGARARRVSGAVLEPRTDAAGRFRFGWASGSRYEVTFAHPPVRRPGSAVMDIVRRDTARIRLGG